MTHEQLKTYESQLKPCPFCGSEATLERFENMKLYRAICNHIPCRVHLMGWWHENIEECIEEWNTRSAESKVLEDIRAEINALDQGITSYHDDRPWVYTDEVLAIIDKHIKGE